MELQSRARVNERMDWINTQLGRDFAYGFVYPQIFPVVQRWLADMKQLKSWGKVNEAIDGFAASLKDTKFVSL